MKRKLFRRFVSVLLAFLIFIEPFAIPIVKAQSMPEPTVINEEVGLMDPADILAPHDYLDEMLNLRGKNREQVELRAWGEWQALINSSYLVIDEGATDVFGLYDALKIAKDVKSTTCSVGDIIGKVWKYAHMTTAFFDKLNKTNRAHTALSCWSRLNKWTEKGVELCKNSKSLNFLSFCCPPSCWHNQKNVSKGMDQYWHWLQKKGGKDVSTELNNAQGVARTIGIGFAIIGAALSIWNYAKNEDRDVGRWSYNRVKDLVAIGFALAGIVAMFCIPIVGQVLAIVTAIWGVLTMIGDMIGEFNKQWKNAYKGSYWYLYENDPEFKSYYDNRAELVDEEKSASLILVENNYKDFKVTEATDDDSTEGRNSRIYIALEKQGVLNSYYNKKNFSFTDYKLEDLMELWEMKASYMAWKPTEAESKKKKSFWQKVGAVFNPKTHVSWVADKIGSIKYNRYVKNNEIERVVFNPDFVLNKKYLYYVTSNRLTDGFYSMMRLRIEQSPFNYIPLLGIDSKDWNQALLEEALKADSFIVGQKEMAAIHNQIELTVQALDKSLDEADDLVKSIDKDQLPHCKKVREFLDEFAEAYKKPNEENKSLYKKAKKLLDFEWDDSRKKTPANILDVCREDIEKALFYDPLALGQKAAEMVLLTITVKQQLDMGTIMNAYVEEKWDTLKSFDKDFKNKDIIKYLKDGTFLSVKGGGFLDWLAELYSTYDESEKTLKQIQKDVDKYNKLAGISASDKRKTFLFFKKSVTTPPELVNKINLELYSWRSTIKAWEKIADEANVKVVLADNPEFAEKVLSNYDVTPFTLEPLDPDNAAVIDIELPYEVSDTTKVEGASAALIED